MARYQPTDFTIGLRAHMEKWCVDICPRPPMWVHWTDGIHSEYRDLAEHVRNDDEVKLHESAAHLLSSQALSFNLFLPFREGARERLSECVADLVGTRLRVEEVRFEWVPPGRLLGELNGDRPVGGEPATAVDVVLWSRLANGRRAAVLIEVKLTEGGFTTCGGRRSRANGRTDVCESAQLFFADPDACYLRRPKGKRRDRRYWQIFAASHGSVRDAFPGADIDGQCPFAGNAQQPMRNLAIARALEQEETVAQAWFALCAHDHNPDVNGHWEAWRALLPDPGMALSLPVSAVIRAGEAEGYGAWAQWMRQRYRLEEAR